MSSVNPLTVGAEIQVAAVSTINKNTANLNLTVKNSKSSFGEFQSDIVNISSLARKKQQQSQQITTPKQSKQVKQLNSEVIEVTSSIGKNTSKGSLSPEQAAAIYNKIASLL